MHLIFHYGALGDFVLTLPLLRRLGGPVTVVSDWPRAVLASKMLADVAPMDIQLWEFIRLHTEGGPTSVSPAVGELFGQAQSIVSYVSDGEDHWAQNTARLAPQAKHIFIDPRPAEDFAGHITDWHARQAIEQGLTLADTDDLRLSCKKAGHIAIHPGSGGEDKCWPVDRYEALIEQLKQRGQTVLALLGETEAEHWPEVVLDRWKSTFDAQLFGSLDELHAALASASAYVGNDSGPTHLAAQMGLPTVALFGPTDPGLWAPVGPGVTVLAPPSPCGTVWLEVQAVLDACPQPG